MTPGGRWRTPHAASRLPAAAGTYADYRMALEDAGLLEFLTETAEHEPYRFGNNGTLGSYTRVKSPAVIARKAYLIEFSVVESDRLALLLGRDILEPRRHDGHEPEESRAPHRLRKRSAREQRRRSLRDRSEARAVACHL